MNVKFKGEWYDIQCFNITKNDGTAFITKDYESSIEDVEINGLHLADSIAHLNNEVSKTEAVEPQDNKPTENLGKEDNFPTKKNGLWAVGDEVMTIDTDGKIFHGKISEMIGDGMCQVMNRDGNTLTGVSLSKLVDDSDGADPNYTAAQINAMQAEYWEERAQRQSDSKEIDWEQRRWDLACRLSIRYHGKERRDAEEIIRFVDVLIDEYRKEAKL